jgi:hypothetical protein
MTASRLAWSLFGVWVVLAATGALLYASEGAWADVVFTPALVVFAAVGALVAARHPRKAIGWLLEAAALALAVTGVLEAYVASADDPPLVTLWADDWIYLIWIALGCVWIPLLFPDGRFLSPRWRRVAWTATAMFLVAVIGRALGDRRLDTSADVDPINPYRLPGVAGDVAAAAAGLGEGLLFVSMLAAIAGVIVRLRRSHGVERQQLKWFAYLGTLMLTALLLAAVSLLDPERLGANIGAFGWGAFLLLFIVGLPLAIGTAILRYRLFDIDIVINRTLVYGALTLMLGATYLALVLLLGLTVGESDVAIAASTLAVAALFRPARARIQALVDRRFYRRRYDAARTIDAFSARLREEVDLDAVGAELSTAVRDTMQPAHLTLWVRR